MQSFKDYLTEGRDFPIYHSTKVTNLKNIVAEGILPRSQHSSKKLLLNPKTANFRLDGLIASAPHKEDEFTSYNGISTTRYFKFAVKWGEIGKNLIIEFNHNEIAKRYKMLPVQYWNNGLTRTPGELSNESEEFIVTTKPVPFNSTFVKKIWIPPNTVKRLGNDIVDKVKQMLPNDIPCSVIFSYTARLNK